MWGHLPGERSGLGPDQRGQLVHYRHVDFGAHSVYAAGTLNSWPVFKNKRIFNLHFSYFCKIRRSGHTRASCLPGSCPLGCPSLTRGCRVLVAVEVRPSLSLNSWNRRVKAGGGPSRTWEHILRGSSATCAPHHCPTAWQPLVCTQRLESSSRVSLFGQQGVNQVRGRRWVAPRASKSSSVAHRFQGGSTLLSPAAGSHCVPCPQGPPPGRVPCELWRTLLPCFRTQRGCKMGFPPDSLSSTSLAPDRINFLKEKKKTKPTPQKYRKPLPAPSAPRANGFAGPAWAAAPR